MTRVFRKKAHIFGLFEHQQKIMSTFTRGEKTVNEFIIGSDFKRESRILQLKFDFIENSNNY